MFLRGGDLLHVASVPCLLHAVHGPNSAKNANWKQDDEHPKPTWEGYNVLLSDEPMLERENKIFMKVVRETIILSRAKAYRQYTTWLVYAKIIFKKPFQIGYICGFTSLINSNSLNIGF